MLQRYNRLHVKLQWQGSSVNVNLPNVKAECRNREIQKQNLQLGTVAAHYCAFLDN